MGLRVRIAMAALLAAAPARANPLEIVGLTSRRAAQANTGVASADDASAVYYDPAGLASGDDRMELDVGWIGANAHLKVNSARAHLADPWGFQLALRAPLPLEGKLSHRIVVGLAMHILPHDVVDIVAPAPDQPYYGYFDRMARLVVLPGAAVRLGHGITVGAAVNVLAGLTGTLAANDGVTRAIDSRVDEQVGTIARGEAGVQWQLAPAWRVGATYRQRFEVPFRTAATAVVGGEPIDLDLGASELFTPHEVVAGVAHFGRRLTLAADAQWSKWSDDPGPYVHVDSILPLAGAVPGQSPRLKFKDTFGARVGVETHGSGPLGDPRRRRVRDVRGAGGAARPVEPARRQPPPQPRSAPAGRCPARSAPATISGSTRTSRSSTSCRARSRRRCRTATARTIRTPACATRIPTPRVSRSRTPAIRR